MRPGRLSRKTVNAVRSYFALLNMNRGMTDIARQLEYRAPVTRETPLWIHIALFAVAAVTTTLAGAQQKPTLVASVLSGLPFSITIMAILLSHEMGHYLAARRFNVRATLPYFIPFPSIIGTMGAVIKIKSPIEDKRALLYIGAMGPLVGFLLSLAATVAGLYLSEVKPLPPAGPAEVYIFGDSLLFKLLTWLIHGSIPGGYDVYLSPYAWAGWIGFLVTSLNLMPMGQLDGSHILYALIGRWQLAFGWAAFVALGVLSFIWPGWIVWIVMALAFLMIGHPAIPDATPLRAREKIIGWLCVIIFIVTFIPVPVDIL